MSNEFSLIVEKRDLKNKSGRKKMFREGNVPGIYYSHDSKESIPFSISKSELLKAQRAETQIYNISVFGASSGRIFSSQAITTTLLNSRPLAICINP